mmetsp:Transcript_48469/g.103690  ORF Transcript_48469/g.103690 Transcript_48469/m.103690 type:complete len:99 (+) Transcript_48469:53-349(+)
MGRRRSMAMKPPKPRPKVDTQFDCPFCLHPRTVGVKMDRRMALGKLLCRICGADYQMKINYLHIPVDVYSDWVDHADAIAKAKQSEEAAAGPAEDPEE